MKWLYSLLLTGCAVGAGGSTIGEWRAKRVVESTACLETSPGVCGKTIEIGSEQPARSFGGGIVAFAVPGYAYGRTHGVSESAFVLDGSYEYMRGRGPFAIGARVGLTLLEGQHHSWIVMPVTALGYWGGAWGSLFAGVGYAPLAKVSALGVDSTYAHDGIEALVGTRIILRETLGVSISFSPELRYQLVGDSTLISALASLGLHF
ncbi:hypothetical protein BH11MYX1_BH11MYX1_03640 [soil metagenome]